MKLDCIGFKSPGPLLTSLGKLFNFSELQFLLQIREQSIRLDLYLPSCSMRVPAPTPPAISSLVSTTKASICLLEHSRNPIFHSCLGALAHLPSLLPGRFFLYSSAGPSHFIQVSVQTHSWRHPSITPHLKFSHSASHPGLFSISYSYLLHSMDHS